MKYDDVCNLRIKIRLKLKVKVNTLELKDDCKMYQIKNNLTQYYSFQQQQTDLNNYRTLERKNMTKGFKE